MNINRNNYEEFFMLYADNELDAVQRTAVEEFAAANPDLQQELELFQQFKLSADTTIVFENKAALLKEAGEPARITRDNYEPYFVLYADAELSGGEKAEVDKLVLQNAGLKKEFDLLQQARLSADTSIVFENKEILYRYEKERRIVPFRWTRIAAAAAILLFVSGFLWINNHKTVNPGNTAIAGNPVSPKQPVPNNAGADVNPKNTGAAIAAINTQEKNEQLKNKREAGIAVVKSKIKTKSSNIPDQQTVLLKEDIASIPDINLKSSAVEPVQEKLKRAEVKKTLIAAADKPLIDQPAIILNPDENKTTAEYASLTTDNVEVLNTTVNTKNALRGFLRKASRLIAKKTDASREDGNRKGILIAGFEIAVR